MNKNVHFVETTEYYNDEFRIYDIAYLSNNIILSTDLIGQLIYYEISDNFSSIMAKETKAIYPISDLDNLISLYSLDIISPNSTPEIIIGSSKGEIIHLKNNEISDKYTNNKSKEFSKVTFINENLFSAGDTKGNVTLFDIRQNRAIKIFSEQSEEITDIIYDINRPDFLLSSSIDSTLSVYDLKQHKLYALSDKMDEELNCLLSIKGCNHILCGSGEGNILIFNWNWFGDFKDQIRGHPEGINTMDKYNDNIIFTGCEDGGIRICSMYPKGLRGILSSKNNKKKNNFKDVNKIKISMDRDSIITCSGIDCLRLYNISSLDFENIYKSNNEFDLDGEQVKEDGSSNEDNNNSNEEKREIKKDEKSNEKEEEDADDELNEKEDDEEDEEDEEEDDEEDDEDYEDYEGNEEDDDEVENDDFKDNEEEKEENEELKDFKGKIQFIKKKRKKDEKSEEDNNSNSDNSDNSDESDDDDSSSTGKKRKTKKVKKLDKNKKTKTIIDKEERKAFFNDL